MKVGELIQQLRSMDPEADVLCSTEDEALVGDGHLFRLFEIQSVGSVQGERSKDEDGIATLALGKSEASEELAMIEITADF